MTPNEAVNLLGFAGDVVPGVRFASTRIIAVAQPDPVEVARRAAAGLGPLLDYDLVEALATLPLDWATPWAFIDPIVRGVLDCAPPGVLRTTPATVERLWRPAVTVTGVVVVTQRWRAGLDAVGLFGPDAKRGLVLSRPPKNLTPVLERAARFGIGVVAHDQGGWQLLAPPAAAHRTRSSPRHWRFLETVYGAWLQAGYAPSSAHARR